MKKNKKVKKLKKTKKKIVRKPSRKTMKKKKKMARLVTKRRATKKLVKKIKKVKKVKKIKTRALTATPKKKRGRPKKSEKVQKKRGRPRKIKETKEEMLRKVAKLGKRKRRQAIEQMAIEKINKKLRKQRHKSSDGLGETVSVRVCSYEKQSTIVAGPNQAPAGVPAETAKQKEGKPLSIEESIKQRLRDRGYNWKESSFKIIEKTPFWWTVEFKDKKEGEVTSYNDIHQYKKDVENSKPKKEEKLSKVELNRYIKKLRATGHNPTGVKVVENKPEYFTIEFRDGTEGPITTCSHCKAWD
jgi:hypothetical protein